MTAFLLVLLVVAVALAFDIWWQRRRQRRALAEDRLRMPLGRERLP